MSKRSEIKEEIDRLKHCIEFGHDFEIKASYPSSHNENVHRISWKCRSCEFKRYSTATKDQLKTIDEYRKLTPVNSPRLS